MDTFITHLSLKNASDERGTGRVSADELESPSANPHSQTTTVRSNPIMSQHTQNQDFQPLTQYDQSLIKNDSWINSTTKKIDPEGNVFQVVTILPRVRPSRR